MKIYCLKCKKKYKGLFFKKNCCGSIYYNTIVTDNFDSIEESILGEGNTPLIKSDFLKKKFGIKELMFKNEMTNPTGSFKDRETSYVVSRLLPKFGCKNIAVASSGNAAISASTFALKMYLKCTCYVSNKVPIEKINFLKLLGTDIKVVKGYYKDTYEYLVDNLKEDTMNITSGQLIDRENGCISIIEEVYDKGFRPDLIVAPVGNGSLLYGLYKGLIKIKNQKIIEGRLPILYGVEIIGNAPIAEAMKQGKDWVSIKKKPRSIADAGIAAQNAYCSPKTIFALRQTLGSIIEIKEEDLYWAMNDIIREGLLPEPTSVSVVSALKYVKNLENKKVLLILTGSGQKMIDKIVSNFSNS